jgi:hypothetical protein
MIRDVSNVVELSTFQWTAVVEDDLFEFGFQKVPVTFIDIDGILRHIRSFEGRAGVVVETEHIGVVSR